MPGMDVFNPNANSYGKKFKEEARRYYGAELGFALALGKLRGEDFDGPLAEIGDEAGGIVGRARRRSGKGKDDGEQERNGA